MSTENARIKSTTLGNDGRGFTAWLHLEMGSTAISFGGFRLDTAKDPLCAWYLRRVLETVGAARWEDLPGKFIRIESEGLGGVIRIGNIMENLWFEPKAEIEGGAR